MDDGLSEALVALKLLMMKSASAQSARESMKATMRLLMTFSAEEVAQK